MSDPGGRKTERAPELLAREPPNPRRARVRAKWTPPPGPLPAGDGGDPDLAPGRDESLDMLSGEWRIFQRRDGHRYSTDDLLCAWFACARAEERGVRVQRALDLGAGIGSIAMMVAWKHPDARVVAVEAQELSLALFARSIRFNGAGGRIDLRRGDLRDAKLVPESRAFDLVTGSPPYFDEAAGVVSDRPQRGPCRFEQRGGVEGYAAAGARALAEHGVMAIVHTWAERERVERAAGEAGLDVVATRPVAFREGREPHLGLYELAHRGARARAPAPEALVIRDARDARSGEYSAAREWMGFPP
jgi:tRNA1Val (adenine37-N6)-methyltransferase